MNHIIRYYRKVLTIKAIAGHFLHVKRDQLEETAFEDTYSKKTLKDPTPG